MYQALCSLSAHSNYLNEMLLLGGLEEKSEEQQASHCLSGGCPENRLKGKPFLPETVKLLGVHTGTIDWD